MGSVRKSTGRSKKMTAKGTAGSRKGPAKTQRGNRQPLLVLGILALFTMTILLVNSALRTGVERFDPVKGEEKKDESRADTPDQPIEEKEGDQGEKAVVPPDDLKNVKIYLIKLDEKTEKTYLSPVQRRVDGKTYVMGTIQELIKGPSQAERRKGFLSAVPENLRVRGISIRNKTAVIDFNSVIEEGAGGSILISRLDQIVYTATQFPEIESIEIFINGRRQKTLGGDGLSISGPLHRRE